MELLAPAGSFEAAQAAVAAGADAIYMGGPLFSARAYAQSSLDGGGDAVIPGDSEKDPLLKSIRYCHLFGVRVYMTLNTLMKDDEFKDLEEYLDPYVREHLDAVIVQDLGLMLWLKKHFPGLPLHVSTQATVTGPRYAGKLLEFGARRVVPARECSLRELAEIRNTGIEVEAFAHGALCYSYSGQCLMSSFIGCRSGNRGRCAGTCRLPVEIYDEHMRKLGEEEENYLLSMKDLCTLDRLEELRDAGVGSLKIEGRMKAPLYVAGVTSVYRKRMDLMEAGKKATDPERDRTVLKEIFDRGGFTDCYLDGRNGRDCLTLTEKPELRIPDDGVIREISSRYLERKPAVKINVTGTFTAGLPAVVRLETADGRFSAQAAGAPVEKASGRPVDREEIIHRIAAFGNTVFEPVLTEPEVEEGIFIPLGTLKELRRRACEKLEKSILESFG